MSAVPIFDIHSPLKTNGGSRLPELPRPEVLRVIVPPEDAITEAKRSSADRVYQRCRLEFESQGAFQVFDLTQVAMWLVKKTQATDGSLQVFTGHTTCAVIINEWESGLLVDLQAALERLVPALEQHFWHDDLRVRYENLEDDEPANGHAHVRSMLLGGPSKIIPVGEGRLLLGKWQRVMLLELDRARPRQVRLQLDGWK